MVVSRPLLIALAAAVLLAAFFFATRALGGQVHSGGESAPSASPTAPKPGSESGASSARQRPAGRRERSPGEAGAGSTTTRRVTRALAKGDVVVLLLTQPGASDDAATTKALKDVDGERVTVLEDRIADIGDYGRLVATAGITQAPATVVIGPDRTAHVLEGYHDGGTLRQAVRDARR